MRTENGMHALRLAAMAETDISFAEYLEGHLAERAWEVSDLAARAGMSPSVIFRYKRGQRPDLKNSRTLAHALGRPLLEVLVVAGLLTPDEAGAHVSTPASPASLSSAELGREVQRRLDQLDQLTGHNTERTPRTGE